MLKHSVSNKIPYISSSPHSINTLILLFSLIFLTTSCVVTPLSPPPLSDDIIRLSELNYNSIILDVSDTSSTSQNSKTVGRQFLFIILPFGRIEMQKPTATLFNTAFNSLTLHGYKPTEAGARLKKLKISIEDVSLYGYDLIFLRRVSASVTLRANLSDLNDNLLLSWTATASRKRWEKFAFAPQLNYVFNQALSEAMDKLLIPLRSIGKSSLRR